MPKVKYALPPGWEEKPAGTGMRVASFSIPGKDGQAAEVSVIPLPGVAGQDLDIVNIWRGQAKLPPISESDLSKGLQSVDIGSRKGQLFEIVSTEPVGDDKFKTRLVVASLNLPGMSWFFKMTGEDALVASQKQAFAEFLKSVSFVMPEASAMASGGASPLPGSDATPAAALPKWQVPAEWKSQPPGQMLLATFAIQDEKLGAATVTVSSFPGDVGGVLANVNRWRDQLGQPPIQAAALDKETTNLDFNGLKAVLTEVSGQSARTGKPARLIGAMVPHDGATWFFKLLGDDAVTAKQREAFQAFIKSVSFDASPAAAPAPAAPSVAPPMTLLSTTPPASERGGDGLPEWQVPANWKRQPPGQMLLATFAIEDAQAGKATLTVSAFPGDVGGTLANVNRWRSQVGLGPIDALALDKATTSLDLAAGKAMLVDVTGQPPSASGGKPRRLLGAMLPHEGQTWYFKLLGDEAVVGKEKEAFLSYLKSLNFAHAR
jgi:hypothetical protein